MNLGKEERIVNFIFECRHLKRIKHEGFRLAGVDNIPSIAEHSLTAAQIGYTLAKMEDLNANKVTTILVWHDIMETRIGDVHRIGSRYIKNKKEIEKTVLEDQLNHLGFGEDIKGLLYEMLDKSTPEGRIAKEADYLEMAFDAQEFKEKGYLACQDWIDNVGTALKSKSAKLLWQKMQEKNFTDWWAEEHLKSIEG